jgi:hypothetical protein
LRRVTEKADAVVILDNSSLYQIAEAKLNLQKESEQSKDAVNDLVSLVMSATTTTLRFPSDSNNDMVSLFDFRLHTAPAWLDPAGRPAHICYRCHEQASRSKESHGQRPPGPRNVHLNPERHSRGN